MKYLILRSWCQIFFYCCAALFVDKNNPSVKKIKGSTAADVTGGMLHKVREAVSLVSDFGIETLIFSGKMRGQLRRALMGDRVNGTRIAAG